MSEAAPIAAWCAFIAVLLWPRPARVGAAAAGAVIGAIGGPSQGHPRWWNRDVTMATILPGRRSTSVPIGFLDGMAAALRAGLTPREAVHVAAADPGIAMLGDARPGVAESGGASWVGTGSGGAVSGGEASGSAVSEWLEPVIEACQAGRPVGPVWQSLAHRREDPDLATLARAWTISERLGAPLADAVAAAAQVSRSRTALRAAIRSATAGAKVTSTLLTLLPLGGIVMAAVMGINPVALYSHPLALLALVVGASLLVFGRWWVAQMIRKVAIST